MTLDEGPKRNKTEVSIRQMEIDDIPAVYHMGEKLFTSEEFPMLYRIWDPYEVTDSFTSDPDYCLVAEANGAIVGFLLATTIEKEGTAWKRYGYLNWIGIDEAFQRTNLGQRLYRRMEERLQEDGVRMVIADTEGNNKVAVAFFKAMGFSLRSEHLWLAKTLKRRAKKEKAAPSAAPSPEMPPPELGQIAKKTAVSHLPSSQKRAFRKTRRKPLAEAES